VDWDLHHGNGTQHSFESDPSILYFSSHQFPYYPGTGRPDETGTGKAEGYTVNVPLPGGQGDEDFIRIYQEVLEPIATQFKPDLVLVSAGFDTYYRDPLGGMGVTEDGFAEITRILMQIADACCDGKIVLTLEGGYHLEGLAQSVKRVILALQETEGSATASPASSHTTEQIVEHIRDTQKANDLAKRFRHARRFLPFLQREQGAHVHGLVREEAGAEHPLRSQHDAGTANALVGLYGADEPDHTLAVFEPVALFLVPFSFDGQELLEVVDLLPDLGKGVAQIET